MTERLQTINRIPLPDIMFYRIAPLLLGTTITLVQPQIASALTPDQVNEVAEKITVLIQTPGSIGSGTLIRKQDNTYTILTAYHVVENWNAGEEAYITTYDGQKYPIKASSTKRLGTVDLALVQFTSSKVYPLARIGNAKQTRAGKAVFVAGFPSPTIAIDRSIYVFTQGALTANSNRPLADGYALVYNNNTLPGMSGGPVLNENGEVIGIHGRADIDQIKETSFPGIQVKTNFNLAVPINTFLALSPDTKNSIPSSDLLPSISSNPLTSDDVILQRSSQELKIIQKLRPVPVFTIATSEGAPLVATPTNPNDRPIAGAFITYEDALSFLTGLRNKNSQLASSVRIIPVSLSEVYQMNIANKGSSDKGKLLFAIIPSRQQVDTAQNLLSQIGSKEQFSGTPIFVARGGPERGYLTIQQGNKTVIPMFFKQEELQSLMERFKQENPKLASTLEVQVLNFEGVLEVMRTKTDPQLEQIVFNPPRESIQYVRSMPNK